jgi:PAS domain S-box-containing protein
LQELFRFWLGRGYTMSTKKSILIVEDESLIAEDLKEIILSLGYAVAGISANGAKAIVMAKEMSPDLITMDLHIQGPIDGISTMELIRKESDVPVIYVTAFSSDPIIERAKKTNPSGYIIKPFNERQIRSAFEIALYNHELKRMVSRRDTMIRTLLNSATDPILLVDNTGCIRAVNEAMARRMGRQADDLPGMDIRPLLEAGAVSEQFAGSVTLALEWTDIRFEELFRNIWYDTHCIPVTDSQGKVSMTAIFSNDVSFRKSAEDQLRTLNERLIAESTALKQTRDELRTLNDQLEEKVRVRTAELEQANLLLTEQNVTLRASNAGTRALLSVNDEAGFIPQICKELVRSGGYSHVWLAGLDTGGKIGLVATAGDVYPDFSGTFVDGPLPACTDPVRLAGGIRAIITPDSICAGCPLSLLHVDRSTIVARLDAGEKSVALLVITLPPGISPTGHEIARIGKIAQEIAFIILYLRAREREQKAYKGIVGYASMGEGELFTKIIRLSMIIDSIVPVPGEG